MKRIFEFLDALQQNNNKVWFDGNKAWYLEVKAYFEDFVGELINRIEEFDSSIYGLSVSDCTYRIYRDIRFSKDKTPYKTHMCAYVCPKGKKSGFGGYYFHLEAEGGNYIGDNILATGAVCMPNPIIQSIREDVYSLFEEFEDIVLHSGDFALDTSNKMKTAPKGFPKDCKAVEFLKLRDFLLSKHIDREFVLADNLAERLTKEFEKTKRFNDFINRAIAAQIR